MAAHYTNINIEEMTEFLTNPQFPGGPFARIYPEGYTEAAFSRRITVQNEYGETVTLPYSLRVNTGIVGEESRECGADAVRVAIFWRENKESKPRMVMGSKRVHRVENWRKNLMNRITSFEMPKICPKCGKPLAVRKGRNGKFLSCIGWKPDRSGCNHTENCPEDME